MIAIDTNILVRFFVNDDPHQFAQADKLINDEKIFISKTVILETEWVLRYAYGYSFDQSAEAFEKLCGLQNIIFEDRQAIETSVVWHKIGLDFADALHLASSNTAKQFITFDKDFIKKGKGNKISKVELVIL